MTFDPNQTEFTNDYQHTAWKIGIQIVPPQVSLAGVGDEETRGGCMQIYNCAMEMLTDMYNYTENHAGKQIGYNTTYLVWLLNGVESAPFKRDIDAYAYFLKHIAMYGFEYDEELNIWVNDRYPLFCTYFIKFADLYKQRKKNMGGDVERLDFRLFAKRTVLTFDDLLRPLPTTEKAYFTELREYAMLKGMKEEKVGTGIFRYVYKKQRSLELRTMPTIVSVPCGLSQGNDGSSKVTKHSSFEWFLEAAEKQPNADELVKYILDNFRFCDGCAANTASRAKEKERKKCGYYTVKIREKTRLACVNTGITMHQYSKPRAINEKDVPMLKGMMDIRIAQIDR